MKSNDQLEPTVFVIFGVAGDLTWRRFVPDLFDLSQNRSLPADFSVLAEGRVDLSDENLRRRLHAGVKKFARYGMVKSSAWRNGYSARRNCIRNAGGSFVACGLAQIE